MCSPAYEESARPPSSGRQRRMPRIEGWIAPSLEARTRPRLPRCPRRPRMGHPAAARAQGGGARSARPLRDDDQARAPAGADERPRAQPRLGELRAAGGCARGRCGRALPSPGSSTAQDAGTGVLFLLDELQLVEQAVLEALCAAMHDLGRRELPLAILAAGLPTLRGQLLARQDLRRAPLHLPRAGDRCQATRQPRHWSSPPIIEPQLNFDPAALEVLLAACQGYPYFIQVYGHAAWQVAAGPIVGIAEAEEALALRSRELEADLLRRSLGARRRASPVLHATDGEPRRRAGEQRRCRRCRSADTGPHRPLATV